MKFSLHLARAGCSCGSGLALPEYDSPIPDGDPIRMSPPLVARRRPVVSLEVREESDIDQAEVASVLAEPFRCPHCGRIGMASHVIVAVEGRPVSASRLEDMPVFGAWNDKREAERAVELPPLRSLRIPDSY